MKKSLVVCLCLLVFACQKEDAIVKLDWRQKIDKGISKYNLSLEVESTKLYEEEGKKGKITYFKENSEGYYKITNEITDKNEYPYFQAIYFLNKRIIKTELETLRPFIIKNKQTSDPCCVLSRKDVYFRTDNSAFKKSKELSIVDFNQYIIKRKEFSSTVDSKEEWIPNANEEYNKILKLVESFKDK